MNLTQKILENSESILNGKKDQIKLSLCAIYAKGHILIEDVPGVGKTTLVKMLGQLLGLSVSRIQFTNDILPNDIIGTSIFDRNENKFTFNPGPVLVRSFLQMSSIGPRQKLKVLFCKRWKKKK